MLKKTITYTDFDGVSRTEDFYFNLSKAELTEMEVSVDGGLGNRLQKIAASENPKELIGAFKKIIVDAFGAKSDDGKYFRKSADIVNDFLASPAYDVLFQELSTNANMAADFFKEMIPEDLRGGFDIAMNSSGLDKTPVMVAVKADESDSSSSEQG